MIALHPQTRFASPPWDRLSPEWLAIDLSLPADHLARLIDRAVSALDLDSLFASYHGVGSLPNPPDLLLKIVLYEMHDGELRPSRWARHCRESTPLQWLAFGLRPARSCLYAFRDRLGPLLENLNAHLLRQAQTDGVLAATRAALDGTFLAAQGSRHKLVNQKTLDKRLTLLQAVITQDAAPTDTMSAEAPTSLATPSPLPTETAASVLPAEPSASQPFALVVAEVEVETSSPPPPAASVSALTSKEASLPEGVVAAPDSGTGAVVSAPDPVPLVDSAAAPMGSTNKAAAPEPSAADKKPTWMANTPRTRKRQHATYQKAQTRLQELHRHHEKTNSRKAKAKRRPAERIVICPSEPEATLGVDKRKTFRPLYNLQMVYDLDSPFILGYGVHSQATDAGLLPPTLEGVQRLTGRLPEEVLADGIYATALDLAWCAQAKVTLYAPLGAPAVTATTLAATTLAATTLAATLPAATTPVATLPTAPLPPSALTTFVATAASATADKGQTTAAVKKLPKKGLIGKEAFTWLAQEQTYKCPQGHLLEPFRTTTEKRAEEQTLVVHQFRCPAVHCQVCPLAAACTRSPQKGRTIKRHEHEGLVEELQQRMASAKGQELYKKRKQTIERIFADLRRHRGVEQLGSYGKARAQIQIGLLVLAHNALALLAERKNQQLAAATLETPRA